MEKYLIELVKLVGLIGKSILSCHQDMMNLENLIAIVLLSFLFLARDYEDTYLI